MPMPLSGLAHHLVDQRTAPWLRRILAVVGLVIATLTCTAAAARSATITHEQAHTTAAAYGHVLIFSDYRTASRRYRLVAKVDGRTRVLRARTRSIPFDVDLGPDRRGRTVAVYSRCQHEPDNMLGDRNRYTEGRGCALYEYSFRTRRESRLPGATRTRGSEVLPTIWRDRIVFAGRLRGSRPPRPRLFTRRLGSSTASKLRGGTPGVFTPFDGDPDDPSNYDGGPGPVQLDLRGSKLAFLWGLDTHDCGMSKPTDRFRFGAQSEVWLADLEGQAKLVDKACEGSDAVYSLFGPSLSAGLLLYGSRRSATDLPSNRLRSYGLTDGAYGEAALSEPTTWVHSDDRQLLESAYGQDGPPGRDLRRGIVPPLMPSEALVSRSPMGPPAGATGPTYAG